MASRRRNGWTVFLALLPLALAILLVAPPAEAGAHAKGNLMVAAKAACRQLAERGVFCEPLGAERRSLIPGIGYYTLSVKVGPGEHDVITLHRVVSERGQGRSGANRKAVLMLSTSLFGFEAAFLGLSLDAEPPQVSFPVYLAQRGVDAWGVSSRWAQVPIGYPDQSFMRDWGMDVSVSDTRVALRIARVARRLGGEGGERLDLLGFSFGAWTALAVANAEADLPRRERDVGGLIPVEGTFKADPVDTTYIRSWCEDADYFQQELDAGHYGIDWSFQAYFNQLALDFPDEPSPFLPGFTNAEAKIVRATLPQGLPGQEWFHNMAGTFDAYGMPTGLMYTYFVFSCVEVTKVQGYDPVRYVRDVNAITCDMADVPWDDHLTEVQIPVLFVGAGGAFGPLMEYQAHLVRSRDVRTHVVRAQPPDEPWLDIGHLDVFWSPVMRDLFWKPMLSWIRAH
jgi:hypothetical protein